MKQLKLTYVFTLLTIYLLSSGYVFAQPQVEATVDAKKIMIGDQVRMFIKATPDKNERLIWAVIPDTFNNLEVVEKGKIDTLQENGLTTYKQRLLITGWDSGMFRIPPFEFTSAPAQGQPYKVTTDSFMLTVQTVPVDTTKPFRPIADIMPVEYTWRDYIWYIVGGLIALILIGIVIYYFMRNKGVKAPPRAPKKPVETPNQKALRLLEELDKKQLWQQDQVKLYYVELTDILRTYIEERFNTRAMELTSDELLQVVSRHRDMARYEQQLSMVLRTADMAKFAKAQPLQQEHIDAFEYTKTFIKETKPVAQAPDNTAS